MCVSGAMGDHKKYEVGWRDGSEVKSAGCSPRGPEFNSQHPHGDSQPSIMTLVSSSGIQVYTHTGRILYIINKPFLKKV